MKKNLLKVKCLCCGKTIAKVDVSEDTFQVIDPHKRVSTAGAIITMPVTKDLTFVRAVCRRCNRKCTDYAVPPDDRRFDFMRLKQRIRCLSKYITPIEDDKKRVKALKRALTRISYEMKMHIILSQV